jgi:hypothetical protein
VNHDLETLAAGSRHGIAGQERLGELHRAVSPRGPARFRGNTAGFMSATDLATEVDDKVARRGMRQPFSQAQRAYDPETGDALARNLICVAMTRAMDSLNVFVMEEAKEKAGQDQVGARSGGATV